MASKNAGVSELAVRYAAALYELASENKAVDQVAGDLENLKRMLAQSPELYRLIRSPAIQRSEQFQVLDLIMTQLGVLDLTRRFVGTVARNRRMFALPAIIDSFRSVLADRRGEVRAQVTVARPLTDEQRSTLDETLKGIFGAKVTPEIGVDPNLLGGIVVRVGSRMIDSTLKTKIERLQLAMKSPGGAF